MNFSNISTTIFRDNPDNILEETFRTGTLFESLNFEFPQKKNSYIKDSSK